MASERCDVECTIPVLPVTDLGLSIDFYIEKLGFILDWRSDPVCSVSRNACHIMLMQRDAGGGGAWVWIGLENSALFDEYRTRGIVVLQEPRNFSWAYEMKVADPDGNVLWLGTESRADLPVVDRLST